MAPRRRHDGPSGSRDEAPSVDRALRAAADGVLRDEEEALEREPSAELAVLNGVEHFVVDDFSAWVRTEAERLSRATGGPEHGAVEREMEVSYGARFRPTVTALGPELAGRGCLTGHEAAQVRDAQTAREIVALAAVLLGAVRKLQALAEREAEQGTGDPRIRSDDPLLQRPYEEH
jgi:hypothetical protein